MDNKIPNMDYDADEVINEFKEKIKWPKSDEVTAVVKPTKIPLRLLIFFPYHGSSGRHCLLYDAPGIKTLKDTQMYLFLILLVVVFMLSFALVCRANKKIERKEYVKKKFVSTRNNCGCARGCYGCRISYRCNPFSVQNRTATFLQSATATLKMTLKISAMTKCPVLTLTVQLRLPTSS